MPDPVADRAFVAQGQRGDMIIGIVARYPAATLADYDGDFAFVIELLAFGWAHQRLPVAGKTAGKADKHRWLGRRRLAILVFLVPVRIIHPETQDLPGVRDRDKPFERSVGIGWPTRGSRG